MKPDIRCLVMRIVIFITTLTYAGSFTKFVLLECLRGVFECSCWKPNGCLEVAIDLL